MTKPSAIILALLSAVLFGASTPAAKLLLGQMDPWLLAGLLYLGSGVGLSLWIGLRRGLRRTEGEAPLRRADLPWLAGAILSGGMLGPVLLMAGLALSSASTAALLLNLEGLATMAIAWVVFREGVDRRLLVGAAAILAGGLLLSWQGGAVSGLSVGSALIVGACVAWGVDNNLTRKISGADPLQITALKGLLAGAVNVGIGLWRGGTAPPLETVAAAGVVGLLGYGVSLSCFILALRDLGAARTGAYFSTAPFIGAALSVALLGDPVTLWLGLAAALMGLGVWLHLTESHSHSHVHEALDHEHSHVHDDHHQHAHDPSDPVGEPHTHRHRHEPMTHTHPHYPDLHHRHGHSHG